MGQKSTQAQRAATPRQFRRVIGELRELLEATLVMMARCGVRLERENQIGLPGRRQRVVLLDEIGEIGEHVNERFAMLVLTGR